MLNACSFAGAAEPEAAGFSQHQGNVTKSIGYL
jgi:hypothetical protein